MKNSMYCKFSQFPDRVWANSVDRKEQSDQGLHCLHGLDLLK